MIDWMNSRSLSASPVVLNSVSNVLRKTDRFKSILKNPIPHSPMTPEAAIINPTIAFFRQRRSPNNSPYEPSCRFNCSPETACHCSGSFRRRRIRIANNAGTAPITNIIRQALPTAPRSSRSDSTRLMIAAVMFPTADKACSSPNANGRARTGITSATRATPTANSPPTPKPVRNRKNAKLQGSQERALRPVKAEYNRIVSNIVFARPTRSPMIPNANPPVAQPSRKIEVEIPP